MGATTPAARLAEVISEAKSLQLKGILTPDENARFNDLCTEGDTLKATLDANGRFASLDEYANKSAGQLPIAGDAPPVGQVVLNGLSAAGATGIQYRQEVKGNRYERSFELLGEYGEGITSTKTYAATNTSEYKDAFKSYVRRGERALKMNELKVLQEGIDNEGGFAVPPDLLERVIQKEPTPTRVAGRVTQLTTTRDKLTMPRINYTTDDLYTSGMRVTWTGEIPSSSTVAAVTEPLFGQTDIPIFTAMMTINLSNDMIEDSGFPIMSWVTGKFAETIELLRDDKILNGTGLGQPSGVLLNPGGTGQPAVVVSGSASTIGTDGLFLIALSMALPEQYDDNAAFVFNKTNTGLAIAELKDSNGRFLWGSGLQDSGLQPSWKNRMLMGYPTVLSGFMPNIGASTYPIIFGDLSGYYLVNRVSFSIQVLREVYATVNQVALVGRLRFGGSVVEPWRLRVGQAHS